MAKSHSAPRRARKVLVPPREPFIEKILEECSRVRDLSFQALMSEMKPATLFPPAIPVASGQINTSEAGFEAVGQLADWYRFEPRELKAKISKDAYARQVLYALGDMISGLSELDIPDPNEWVQPVTSLYKEKLAARLDQARQDRVQILPCHLFDTDQKATSFEIGPVTFHPRDEWIKGLDPKIAATVEQIWSGALAIDQLRDKAFAPGSDWTERSAYDVVTTVGRCGWVATAAVTGYDPIQSLRKGTVLVSLAIDALTLLFHPEQGARLAYAGGERVQLGERHLSADAGGRLFGSSKINRLGLGGPPGLAESVVRESEPFRKAAGIVLGRYDRDAAAGGVPRLVERWANALHWYGQALREPSDFMALVKFGCSIDILSDAGGNLESITSYAASAFGCEPDTELTADKRTLRDVMNAVYNDGRSAIAHGSSFGLLAEMRPERSLATSIVRQLLSAVTEPLAQVIDENHRMLELQDDDVRAFTARLRAVNKPTTGTTAKTGS